MLIIRIVKYSIYNYEQLKQIGSDAYIYTGDKDGQIGSGEVVKSEGTELKYGADAQYILMNDIQMNSEQIWSVPDSFTGTNHRHETRRKRNTNAV